MKEYNDKLSYERNPDLKISNTIDVASVFEEESFSGLPDVNVYHTFWNNSKSN